MLGILKKETQEIRAKHAVPRRSALWEEEAELTEQDFLANDRSVVMMTESGYIKVG